MIVAVPFGLLIGAMLGMVGGGGAVLALPVLVFVVGLDVHEATTVSLAIVAAGAATGALSQIRAGTVCWSSAGWFAVAAIGGSLVGSLANRAVSGDFLLIVFSVVALFAAKATWDRAGKAASAPGGCPDARAGMLVPLGLAVGALTGLVGVGGGFLVVPALAIGSSFGLREAMATSMVIVAIVSLAGLASHLLTGSSLDAGVTITMGLATIAGALLGARLAPRVPTRTLGHGFAVLLVAVAVAIGIAVPLGATGGI